VCETQAREIEAGEDEHRGVSGHRQRKEYGQGVEYEERDEIGDGVNKPVIAQAETREQRALPEAWEQAHQAG